MNTDTEIQERDTKFVANYKDEDEGPMQIIGT